MSKMDKLAYAHMFGPTTGDRVRLGDTSLLIEIEKDYTPFTLFAHSKLKRH